MPPICIAMLSGEVFVVGVTGTGMLPTCGAARIASSAGRRIVADFVGSALARKRDLRTWLKIHLGIGNGVGKQGRGNRPPYRRYGPDTEIQYRLRKPHGPAKRSRILSKREADTEFQYRPYIVDTDTIADALFADAISETSKELQNVSATRLCQVCPSFVMLSKSIARCTSAE